MKLHKIICKIWGGHFYFIPNGVQKTIATYWENVKFIIYLNVNKLPIIHYENIFRIYLIYLKIYLKYSIIS
jgi:hypothetical protein